MTEVIYLWEILQEAKENPQEVEWNQIWEALNTALVDLDISAQLALAGEAVSQISLVFQSRSRLAFEELDAIASDEGPIMPSDAFAQFVRQSMHVDFDEFIEPVKPYGRKPYEKNDSITSVAVVVDKQDVLDVLDDFARGSVEEVGDMNSVLELSHAENVSDWVGAIASYFVSAGVEVVSWSELCEKITIPPVEIWLGLLLGNFVLTLAQSKNLHLFYDSEILVSGNKAAVKTETR